eukprot:gene14965-biopygen84
MIVPVLKPGGILVDVDSYRPLQMLSYDYRLLAKVLANRLASAANSIIDPAQCAFVPRRSIGDSIRLLQLLAPMLHAEQRAAVVAFLDFRKAYDTVDREFLCSVAATLGAVDTFVSNMQVFGAASGQHLQPAKCSLLPVGAVPPAMSALPQQSGLRITTHARSLGVDFDSTGVLGLDWQQRMQQVRQRLQKITRIPHLSAFGRAFAVNAYALSTLLY